MIKYMDIHSYMKKNGFIWGPEPEIYDGVAGFYTYGPNGKKLKNKVEDILRKNFTKNSIHEVETPIIAPEIVWKASGHLGKFTDPLIKDIKGGVHRVDKLIEDFLIKNNDSPDNYNLGSMNNKEFLKFIIDKKIKSPNGLELKKEIINHDLMMETKVSVDRRAFNRPETATMTYLPFKSYYEFYRKKLPFGVFQIGKAFRNEISPRNSVLRGREFTQAEAQIFYSEDQKKEIELNKDILKSEIPLWSHKDQSERKLKKNISIESCLKKGIFKSRAFAKAMYLANKIISEFGFPIERIRFRQHNPNEMAFYAEDAWDLEIKTNSQSWIEVAGIHDRKDYDLSQHQKMSNKNLEAEGSIPHIMELAFGTDRLVYSILDIFMNQEKVNNDNRIVLKLPPSIQLNKFAVFPLQKKDGLLEKAQEIHTILNEKYGNVMMDISGSIGKRYRRQDEIGTKNCITIDYDTLKDNTVTIRDRDTMVQKRIKIKDLK